MSSKSGKSSTNMSVTALSLFFLVALADTAFGAPTPATATASFTASPPAGNTMKRRLLGRRLASYTNSASDTCGATPGMTAISKSSDCRAALDALYPAGSAKAHLWIGSTTSRSTYPCGCYVATASSNSPGYFATSNCGGSHMCGKTVTSSESVKCACARTVVAPVITDYKDATATYTVGVAIADNIPGHQAAWWATDADPTTYAISPSSLPGGLSFDAKTGWITGTPLATAGQGTGPVSFAITATNSAGSSSAFTVKITVFAASYPGLAQIEATCTDTVERLVGTHFLKRGHPSKTYFVNCPAGCDASKTRAEVYGCGGHGGVDVG